MDFCSPVTGEIQWVHGGGGGVVVVGAVDDVPVVEVVVVEVVVVEVVVQGRSSGKNLTWAKS